MTAADPKYLLPRPANKVPFASLVVQGMHQVGSQRRDILRCCAKVTADPNRRVLSIFQPLATPLVRIPFMWNG
jgi:hypothetical protein